MSARGAAFRIVLVLALAGGACGQPEQRLVDGYFRAVNTNDNTTLSSMSVVPFDKKVERWAINRSSEEKHSPVGEDAEGTLPYLVKQVQELEKAMEGNKKAAREYRDAHYAEWEQAQKLSKDAKVPAKLQAVKTEYDKFSQTERDLRKALAAAKEAVDRERHPVTLSIARQLRPEEKVEGFQGEMVTKELDLTLTVDGQPQPYTMTLKRYHLKDASGASVSSRWVVFGLAPKG